MTDLERFIELYDSVGIKLEPVKNWEGKTMLHLEVKDQPQFAGYYGLYTEIVFDNDGKFIGQILAD